jgi:hypothetical protein
MAERVALRRLEAALVAQARVGDVYARWSGTSAEQSCYSRLRAASQQVAECEQAVKAMSANGSGETMRRDASNSFGNKPRSSPARYPSRQRRRHPRA